MASSTSERARPARSARCALGALALALAAAPAASRAQRPPAGPPPVANELDDGEEAPATLPDGTRRVTGRVVTPRDSLPAPVAGAWVTLHRVGRDAAGPLDSVRTAADGSYAFTFRPRGEPSAVYFAAASRGGVAYFAPPLRGAVTAGDAGEITVFDTTSRAVPLTVRGRHLIVSRPDTAGRREVLEVFELSNDTTVTAVPPAASGRGVWSAALPAGALRFAARESGDVPADGLVALGGAATLMVPVAPGLKQVAFSYQLPSGAFPLRVAVDRPAGLFEVLLEEPEGSAVGRGLAPVAPVVLEGRSFRRWVGQNVAAGTTVVVAAGPDAARPWPQFAVPALLAVVGGGMAGALVLASRRRPGRPDARRAAAPAPEVSAPAAPAIPVAQAASRDHLLAELAALDDGFARHPDPSPAERAAYEAERARLRGALGAELAAGVSAAGVSGA